MIPLGQLSMEIIMCPNYYMYTCVFLHKKENKTGSYDRIADNILLANMSLAFYVCNHTIGVYCSITKLVGKNAYIGKYMLIIFIYNLIKTMQNTFVYFVYFCLVSN